MTQLLFGYIIFEMCIRHPGEYFHWVVGKAGFEFVK